MSFFRRFKNNYLVKEEWSIALRKRGQAPLFEDGGTKEEFVVLKNSLRYWAADPFLFSYNGKSYLFFEMFDRFKSKGLIGYREIINGKASKMKVAFEAEKHLSFPFIFEKDSEIFMIPEYCEGMCLPVYKAEHFPDKWALCEKLFESEMLVDSAIVNNENGEFLLTQKLTENYKSKGLFVYFKDDKGIWKEHPRNPVITDEAYSRLGGGIIYNSGKFIRVCQDCSKEYGKKLYFQKISALSSSEYNEELIKSIDVNQIKLKAMKNSFRGVHTYNLNENFEVVDLKNKDRVKSGNIINIVYRIMLKI